MIENPEKDYIKQKIKESTCDIGPLNKNPET